jgi:hypothetical protein
MLEWFAKMPVMCQIINSSFIKSKINVTMKEGVLFKTKVPCILFRTIDDFLIVVKQSKNFPNFVKIMLKLNLYNTKVIVDKS